MVRVAWRRVYSEVHIIPVYLVPVCIVCTAFLSLAGIYISIVFLATAVHAYRFPVAGRFVDSFFGMYICISRL